MRKYNHSVETKICTLDQLFVLRTYTDAHVVTSLCRPSTLLGPARKKKNCPLKKKKEKSDPGCAAGARREVDTRYRAFATLSKLARAEIGALQYFAALLNQIDIIQLDNLVGNLLEFTFFSERGSEAESARKSAPKSVSKSASKSEFHSACKSAPKSA